MREMQIGWERRRVPTWAILLAPAVLWVALASLTFPDSAHHLYTWDSAAYLEAAQSLVRGDGLKHRVVAGFEPEIWEPMALWPPGYPMLIAAAHLLGAPLPEAGVIVAIASAAVFVILLGWIALRFFPPRIAVLVVAVTAAMPAFLRFTINCLSEAPYMACAAAALACAIAWSDRRDQAGGLLFAAGVLAAAAWAVRNVGLALMPPMGIFIAAICIRRNRPLLPSLSIWTAGIALIVGPVLARNIGTFGELNPYELPPSDLSVGHNLEQTVKVLVHDLTALTKRAIAAVAVAVLAVSALAGRRFRLSALRKSAPVHPAIWLLGAYGIASVVLVVAARSQYKWGEPIYSRYLVPVYWIAWICLAQIGLKVLNGLVWKSRRQSTLVALALGAVLVLQVRAEVRELRTARQQLGSLEALIGENIAAEFANAVPPGRFVLASRAYFWRVFANVNARKTPAHPFGEGPRSRMITAHEAEDACRSRSLWGIVADDPEGMRRGDYGTFLLHLSRKASDVPWLVESVIAGVTVYRCHE